MIENTFLVDCFALVGAHQRRNQINDSHGQYIQWQQQTSHTHQVADH